MKELGILVVGLCKVEKKKESILERTKAVKKMCQGKIYKAFSEDKE